VASSTEPGWAFVSGVLDGAVSSGVPKGLILSSECSCPGWLDPANTAIEEKDVGCPPMECAVEVARACHGRSLAIVEKPDGTGRFRDGIQAHSPGIPSAAVDETVQGEVEEQVTVAPARVGRAEPEAVAQWSNGVGSPRSFVVVGRDSHHRGQVGVPGIVGGDAIGCPIGRQPTAGIHLVQMGSEAPLLEMGEAGTGASGVSSACQRWQQERRENSDDTEDHQQFKQGKGLG